MKKKALSLLLACAMTFSLAACGGKGGETEAPAADNAETEAPAEAGNDAEAGDDAEAPAASDGAVIKIGGIGPTTGGASAYGIAVQRGMEIAVEEINGAGGIGGVQIELNFQDDEHDPEKSVNAYNTLKDWGMQVLIGSVTSNPCIAVAEQTYNDNMFQLTPSGTAVKCVQYDNAFRMCFSDPNQGLESAKYIGENGLATKVAVIYDSSDPYSVGIYEAFRAEAANQNIEIVSDAAFTADNRTDFSTAVQGAKNAGAELLYMPFYYTEASLVLAECSKQSYAPLFFGVDGMDGILSVENFDASLAEDLMYMAPFVANSDDEMVKSFVGKYQEKYGEIPNQFAADAYDCVYVVKAAMEEAGVTADMDASAICDALKTAMTSITFDGITGKGISWEASGEPNKAPLIVQIKGGEGVAL
ncbi:MAG: ABC transporter substrate-binding protein [Lachnospiraceae bacterium]|jgi:branched-chain amino acid transport system substrate-binding protein|nr:ABC transporter substrate-binding protein [Lachnospiraceae bacterium]